jgi:hypothetical protein
MKHIFILLLSCISLACFSQEISGVYKPIKKSNDPQGGSVFFVTDDNHWGAMAFGTALYGSLEKVSDSLYVLSHSKPESPFLIYGRKNSQLLDTTRIFFSDFTSGSYLVYFNEVRDTLPKARQVFSDTANGFLFPYVHSQKGVLTSVSLARRFGIEDELYDFIKFNNPNGYNEFVIENHSKVFYKRDRIVVIKNQKLYGLGRLRNGYQRISGLDSTVIEMNDYLKAYYVYPDRVFYSSQYKSVKEDKIKEENWRFEANKNYYYRGEQKESIKMESKADFNTPGIVYPYEIVLPSPVKNTGAQIIGSPLFKTSLED